jgi:hypothetical protein
MADFKPSQISGDVDATATIEGISLTDYSKVGSVSNVAESTKTTIVSQAYVAGTFENLTLVSVSGEDYAKFFVTLNTVDLDIRRTGPDRNLTFTYTGAPYALSPGDVVDIKVEHYNAGQLVDFDATIYGYPS